MHWLVTHRKKPKAREPTLIGVLPACWRREVGGGGGLHDLLMEAA